MRINMYLSIALCLGLASCGGGSDSQSSANTTVNSCSNGAVEVSASELPEIVDAAVDAGVEVEDHSEDIQEEPTVDQSAALRTGGFIIAACGGTVIANDSEDNDTVSQVKKALYSGRVYRLEIHRGPTL